MGSPQSASLQFMSETSSELSSDDTEGCEASWQLAFDNPRRVAALDALVCCVEHILELGNRVDMEDEPKELRLFASLNVHELAVFFIMYKDAAAVAHRFFAKYLLHLPHMLSGWADDDACACAACAYGTKQGAIWAAFGGCYASLSVMLPAFVRQHPEEAQQLITEGLAFLARRGEPSICTVEGRTLLQNDTNIVDVIMELLMLQTDFRLPIDLIDSLLDTWPVVRGAVYRLINDPAPRESRVIDCLLVGEAMHADFIEAVMDMLNWTDDNDQTAANRRAASQDMAYFSTCMLSECRLKSTQRCGACKVTPYCSLQHQRRDWKHHKAICVRPSYSATLFCESDSITPSWQDAARDALDEVKAAGTDCIEHALARLAEYYC